MMLVLAACGQGGGAPAVHSEIDACALLGSPDALFGAGATATPSDGSRDGMAGVCQWASADGRRVAGMIVYSATSLGAVTPTAQVAATAEKWDAMTETPLADVAGLGDEAKLAADLPGYQTQIVFRKGDKVVLVQANSGDEAMDGAALARRMADAAAAAL